MDFIAESSTVLQPLINTLCRNLELNYFAHVRVKEKTSISSLGTRNSGDAAQEWLSLSMPIPIPSKPGFFIASSFPQLFPAEKLRVIKEKYGVDNGAFYVNPQKEYCDVFVLGGDPDNPRVVNNYANHCSNWVGFATQFSHDAKHLIKIAEKKYPYVYEQNTKSHEILTINEYDDVAIFSGSRKFQIALIKEFELQLLNLSPRELQCLTLAAKGFTAKESAKALELRSFRTVEGYLENAKNKLGCYGPGGKRQMIVLFRAITRT